MGRVLVPGTFDRFHHGHENLLARAARFGPVTVALSTDVFAARYKRWPADSYLVRRQKLIEHPLVDDVVARNDFSMREIVEAVRPEFWITGNDWMGDHHWDLIGMTADELTERNLSIMYVPRTVGVSTTQVLEREVSVGV